ncbi:hypothetical protein GHT06_020355 [Daphnia sinensis]|uniref:Uncharacterized protein n=1 Tax=Daphnia sinensis TaxID=1820382 RepID=A0AAD5L2K8_9CRUS|nr:hypothetical protein GHT06_020355 [Daphnia sinensis]
MVLTYLKKHYGSREQIARGQIYDYDLLSHPVVQPGDRQGLEDFFRSAARVVLEHGRLEHDLKSAGNLDQAVQKLPPFVCHRWPGTGASIRRSDLDRFLEEIVEEERLVCSSTESAPQIEPRERRVTFHKPAVERHNSVKRAIRNCHPFVHLRLS